MDAPPQRCVLDTNQIVGAGSRWVFFGLPRRRNPHLRLLVLVLERHVGLCHEEILREYTEKLMDRGSPPDRARAMVARIRGAFEMVPIALARAPVPPRDPDDEVFLLCALDGNADYLVSEDDDLLTLKDDYARPSIVSCAEALAALQSLPAPPAEHERGTATD